VQFTGVIVNGLSVTVGVANSPYVTNTTRDEFRLNFDATNVYARHNDFSTSAVYLPDATGKQLNASTISASLGTSHLLSFWLSQ